MKLILKYIKNNLNENLGRTVLIMLSLFVVSLLIAIITLMLIFGDMLLSADTFGVGFDTDIQSRVDNKLSEKVIENLNENFDILGISSTEYGYITNESGALKGVPLIGLDFSKAIKFKLLNLKENFVLEQNEVVISSDISKKYNLNEGDEFEYWGRNGEKNILKVKYVEKNIFKLDPSIKIITTEEIINQIKGREKSKYEMAFANYIGDEDSKSEIIKQAEDEYGISISGYEKQENLFKEYIYPVVIILLLVFSVIFVSLNSIVKIILNERIPEIGTFRSIGATKKQVMGILILELSIYSIIPSLLGGAFGVMVMKGFEGILNSGMTLVGLSEINMAKYILPIALSTFCITLLFQILLSIFELIKVSKLSIKDTIFNKHTSTYKYTDKKVIFGVFFLIIGLLSLLEYKKLNYWFCLIAIISILVSIALVVPTLSLIPVKLLRKSKNPILKMALDKCKNSNLQINTNIIFVVTVSVSLLTYSFANYLLGVEKSKENAVNSSIYVEQNGEEIYDKTDDFFSLENVKSVTTLYDIAIDTGDIFSEGYDKVKFANKNIKEIHCIFSSDYESLMKDCNLVNVDSDKLENLKTDEIIVSEYYKKIYNLKEGDVVVLEWETEEEKFSIETPLNLKIAGFTNLDKIKNNSIIISSDLGKKLSGITFNGYSNIKYFVNLNDDSSESSKQTRKDIINQIGIVSDGSFGLVFTKAGYIKEQINSGKDIKKYTIMAIVVIVLLSCIGILNNQKVSFMERRRELATLYSIAMSKKQINSMILLENSISFIISSLVSIIFYIILSMLIGNILQVLLIPISLKFTVTGIAVFILVILLILFAIQKSMRNHIKNMNVVEELKYE